jgi:hypothetical protein
MRTASKGNEKSIAGDGINKKWEALSIGSRKRSGRLANNIFPEWHLQ